MASCYVLFTVHIACQLSLSHGSRVFCVAFLVGKATSFEVVSGVQFGILSFEVRRVAITMVCLLCNDETQVVARVTSGAYCTVIGTLALI